jgi:PEP-CTERM motif-containing protein
MSVRVIAVGLLSVWAFQAQALLLMPSTSGVIAGTAYGPDNCEPGCVEKVFDTEKLTLLYKADVGEVVLEEGAFAPYYQTAFLNTAFDPSGAVITNLLGAWITCGECYLAIKDGMHSPGYYFFDLSGWNGTETLTLANFWPNQGAISHVSIWGDHTSVPEPGTLSLLGAGLLLAAFGSRRKLAR